MELIKPISGRMYFISYFYALVYLGSTLYVIKGGEISMGTLTLAIGASASLFDCYWWCHMLDSFINVVSTNIHVVLCHTAHDLISFADRRNRKYCS